MKSIIHARIITVALNNDSSSIRFVFHCVQIAIVIEIAQRTAATVNNFQDARSSVERYILEFAVAQIAIEYLALAITRFAGLFGYFRIDVAIARENIGPTIVVKVAH